MLLLIVMSKDPTRSAYIFKTYLRLHYYNIIILLLRSSTPKIAFRKMWLATLKSIVVGPCTFIFSQDIEKGTGNGEFHY